MALFGRVEEGAGVRCAAIRGRPSRQVERKARSAIVEANEDRRFPGRHQRRMIRRDPAQRGRSVDRRLATPDRHHTRPRIAPKRADPRGITPQMRRPVHAGAPESHRFRVPHLPDPPAQELARAAAGCNCQREPDHRHFTTGNIFACREHSPVGTVDFMI